ncbi:MAG: FtsK/SpoIIIE domain-containing protein [Dermatophilus congolensis]|nr:FtsK/SpoIIIE domain-containing protein [Dermatophilus congolensis]
MFGAVQTSTPVRVQLDRTRTDSGLGAVFAALGRVLGVLVVSVWRAPVLALGAASVLVAVWALTAGYWLPVLGAALTVGVLVGVVAWRRPAWLRGLGSLLAGEVLRVFVYRPRWATACLAARAVVRVGSAVHVPGLVRHQHRHGFDVLTVRSAPGQTLADWQAACPGLASTFAAHSVSVREGLRPGWVVLDVLRRDPLGAERVAPNPARHTAGDVELGRDEYGHPVTVDPYGTAHMGLQGASRSGKSSTSYTLLAALAHRSDVVVCGVDPSGLLLGAFVTGPAAAYIATGTRADDLTHTAHVLSRLVELMDSRIADLRSAGVDKFATYTAAVPVVWVVLEEYPGLLSAAKALDGEKGAKAGERIAPRLERAVGRLVKEGAKVGVCVLVISQRMSADALATDDRANLAVRCSLRVDNADAVVMLHDGIPRAGLEAVRQFKPGVGLFEAPGLPLRRVRMHHTDYATYRRRVAAGLAATHGRPLTASTVILGQTIPAGRDVDAGRCGETVPLPVIGAQVVVPV